MRNDESVALYDPSRMRVLATLDVPGVKHVYWSPDNSRVALCSSSCVVLANRNLSTLATSVEHLHVKSGLWMDSGVFLFNTPHNLKYIMVQGDVGVLCSLAGTIYMAAVVKNEIVLVSRTGDLSRMSLNDTEVCSRRVRARARHYSRPAHPRCRARRSASRRRCTTTALRTC